MASKSKDADTIKEMAKMRYDRAHETYEAMNQKCVDKMKQVDELKFEIWESFTRFLDVFEKIKNRPELTGTVEKEKLQLTAVELEELKMQTTKLKDAAATVTGAAVGGGAAALGATVALSGIGLSAFTVMGVGQALVTTASFASVNIALYGVGAVFWPAAVVAAAATAVGALFSSVHGNKKLREAHEVEEEVDMACAGFREACDYLQRLEVCATKAHTSMSGIYGYYKQQLERLCAVVEKNNDYKLFSEEEQYLLEAVTVLVAVLKKLTQTPLLVSKEENNKKKEEEQAPEINEVQVNATVQYCTENFEIVKKQQETWCKEKETETKEVVYENVVIDGTTNLKDTYENKNIVFQKGKKKSAGQFVCRNCKITFDVAGETKLDFSGVKVAFEQCTFVSGKEQAVQFICKQKSEVLLKDCRFEECNFGDGLFDMNHAGKFELAGCTLNHCTGLLAKFESVPRIYLADCYIDMHVGGLLQLESCGGAKSRPFEVKNCTFSGTAGKEKTNRKNAVAMIDVTYSPAHFENCVFENIDASAFVAQPLSEEISFIGCKFRNIHSGEKKKGMDKKTYYTNYAVNIPGGRCLFSECDFNDVSGLYVGSIGSMLNEISRVEKCNYTDCRGDYVFMAAQVLGCNFLRCSSYAEDEDDDSSGGWFSRSVPRLGSITNQCMVRIYGLAAKGSGRCLSEISNCTFTKCFAKDYLIAPYNALHKKEICVSINNNLFKNCDTDSGELYTTEYQEVGERRAKTIATESGNEEV